MQVGWVKIGHFRRKMRYNSKTVQDRRLFWFDAGGFGQDDLVQ